jgi:hypothetical protein
MKGISMDPMALAATAAYVFSQVTSALVDVFWVVTSFL